MNRCTHCQRPFGLIRHHHWGRSFCRKACVGMWLDDMHRKRLEWWKWLYGEDALGPSHGARRYIVAEL